MSSTPPTALDIGRALPRAVQARDRTTRSDDEARLRTHAREQEALHEIAILAAGGTDQISVFAAIAKRLGDVLDGDFSAVARRDPSGRARLVGSWSGPGLPTPAIAGLLDLDDPSAISEVLQRGYPVSRTRCECALPGVWLPTGSELATPITVNGRPWGAATVVWGAEAGADEHALLRMTRIAELVAPAIARTEHGQHGQHGEHTRRGH